MTSHLWIRADASRTIGLGHVMRTIALAEQAPERGLTPTFVVGGDPIALDLATGRGFGARFAGSPDDELWLDDVKPGDAVVFDGYDFTPAIMEAAGRRTAAVGAVDDLGAGVFPVRVLLNQNPIESHDYDLPSASVLLTGPEHALVRGEFLALRRQRGHRDATTLLVTLGGSDAAGLTARITRTALRHGGFRRIVCVVGPSAHAPEGLDGLAAVDVVRSPPHVAQVFDRADAAISAAGSTTWELLAMGIPTALVQVAENQAVVGRGAASSGIAHYIGTPEDPTGVEEALDVLVSNDRRGILSRRGMAAVPGRGPGHFIEELLREPPPPPG